MTVAGFLVDEDLPWRLARVLSDSGFEAQHVYDVALRGAPDDAVFGFAQSRNLSLVTCDMAYADIRRFPLGSHAGLVIARISNRVPVPQRINSILDAIRRFNPTEIPGSLIVISARRVRRRHQ